MACVGSHLAHASPPLALPHPTPALLNQIIGYGELLLEEAESQEALSFVVEDLSRIMLSAKAILNVVSDAIISSDCDGDISDHHLDHLFVSINQLTDHTHSSHALALTLRHTHAGSSLSSLSRNMS
jgi:hypothetical protein